MEHKILYLIRRILVFTTGLVFVMLSKTYLQELEYFAYWIFFTIGIAIGRIAFIGFIK